MGKIDIEGCEVRRGSGYPAPFHETGMNKLRHRLGLAAGLTAFGVNRLTLHPGAWSGQRHWHSHEDEFVMVLEGEVVMVTDAGEEVLRAGDCAAFKAGETNGHHMINRTDKDAVLLEVGNSSEADICTYSDIDMVADAAGYKRRDGTPYPVRRR